MSPKSLSPDSVAVEIEGIRYINLSTLIELKIASGMTNPQRAKDFGDVVELIRNLGLPSNFSEGLNPFVQSRYKQLWADANVPAKRYVTLWRNKSLTAEAKSLEEMIEGLQAAAETLRPMLADGVTLDREGGTSDDYAYLVTIDPAVAKKYDMHDESEFLGAGGADDEPKADNPRSGH